MVSIRLDRAISIFMDIPINNNNNNKSNINKLIVTWAVQTHKNQYKSKCLISNKAITWTLLNNKNFSVNNNNNYKCSNSNRNKCSYNNNTINNKCIICNNNNTGERKACKHQLKEVSITFILK